MDRGRKTDDCSRVPAAPGPIGSCLETTMRNDLPSGSENAETCAPPAAPKKPWVQPAVTDLPRLTDLTLQTGSPVGDPVGGGSSVFP